MCERVWLGWCVMICMGRVHTRKINSTCRYNMLHLKQNKTYVKSNIIKIFFYFNYQQVNYLAYTQSMCLTSTNFMVNWVAKKTNVIIN